MGELIRKEAAAAPARFSGERLTAAASGQVEVEHYHRYLLARSLCRGKDVLDVAAGEGYGTALLAQVARSAVGVEIDVETVTAARRAFHHANLRFEQGDARALPLPDACIDVAVSFETLEHLAEHDLFLSELHRVLRPGGLLVISTPDSTCYSVGAPPNPFHVLELTGAAFEALLSRHFAHHVVAGQRPLIGSVIMGGQAQGGTLQFFEKRSQDIIEASDHVARAPYRVALASDGALPALPDSVYLYRDDLDTDMQTRREAELGLIAARQATTEALDQVDQATQRVARAEARASAATAITAEALLREAGAARMIAELQARLAEPPPARLEIPPEPPPPPVEYLGLRHHITAILDLLPERFPRGGRTLRRALRLGWWTASGQLGARIGQWRARHDIVPTQEITALPTPEMPLAGAPPIMLPVSDAPVVSIVIATYGQPALTLGCLRSIAAHPPTAAIEVIVVDDAYPGPDDVSSLETVVGIRLLRNPTNLGFLRSCNHAARQARGRYILLLNNDTELLAGAIDALVDLLEARPDAGMAGAKLLFPNGLLQEAGGVLWADASGWNYGRGQDPLRPEFNYTREVDWCTGAAILVRAALFAEMGGFDEAYAPAYYEDVDLAFRMRARGWRTLYAPRSVVVHHEGMTHGTDLTAGVKAFQVVNQGHFMATWKATLQAEHYPSGTHEMRARDKARTRRVILIIDHYAPEPDRDAGSRSAMGIIDSLLDAGWVVKFWPHNRAYSPVYTPMLEDRGVEMLDSRWPGSLADWLTAHGMELDHLLAIRPDIAADVIPLLLRTTTAVLSFYGVDLHFARMRRQAALDGDAGVLHQAELMQRLETRVWRSFDMVIYPSDEEAETVRQMAPRTPARGIVPFTFEVRPARMEPPQGRSLLFVAGFAHPPNVDAAVFLIGEILPALERQVGRVKVVLAGSNPTATVQALAGPDVEVTGWVSDAALEGLYDTHRASVVPLRFGAGVKGKVVESLSHGLPVVTTSIGAQGIAGLAEIVPVADDVAAIVAALARLLTDDDAWRAQSARQMAFAEERFSRAAMRRSVLAALEEGEALVASSNAGHAAP